MIFYKHLRAVSAHNVHTVSGNLQFVLEIFGSSRENFFYHKATSFLHILQSHAQGDYQSGH